MRLKRTIAVAGAAGMLMVGAAACQPYFSGDTLTVTPVGQLAQLTWTPAQDDDAGETVDHYGIEINGTEVTTFPAASGLSCVLTGLSSGTTYTLSVTAYGNTGQWSGEYSGDVASLARVSTSYTNGTTGAPATGAGTNCFAPTDSDGDRLPDAVENNNGTFVSAAKTGTSPNNADTDADGIKDGDEVFGSTGGLNLYGMGTRPVKKDLLFEFDWFDDNLDPGTCTAHSHRPTAAMISRVQTAFGGLSTPNPNGTTGVNVIGDYGQGGLFTGGNFVADADGVLSSGVNSAEFLGIKSANFAANREGYFHYVVLPHNYNVNSTSSGQAELPGDDLIVSLQCYSGTVNTGNTIMHEVGHNLNLHHGGNVDTNWKPNYNSVMNYRFQFPGIDTTCDANGDNVLSYSNGTRITLNEFALVEANGVCGPGFPIDWSGNAVIDAGTVAYDINQDGGGSTLTDFNDHTNMCLTCIADADGASPTSSSTNEVITEQPVPPEAQVVGR